MNTTWLECSECAEAFEVSDFQKKYVSLDAYPQAFQRAAGETKQ